MRQMCKEIVSTDVPDEAVRSECDGVIEGTRARMNGCEGLGAARLVGVSGLVEGALARMVHCRAVG